MQSSVAHGPSRVEANIQVEHLRGWTTLVDLPTYPTLKTLS